MYCVVVEQLLSHIWLFVTPWTATQLSNWTELNWTGLQHIRLPCSSLSPKVCSNSCPLSQWCLPAICHPLLLLPSTFPSIRVFSNKSTLRIRYPKNIGASALASVPPVNIQGWFPLGLTSLISLLSKEMWRVFSSSAIQKHQFFGAHSSLWSNTHTCTWVLEKPYLWQYRPLSAKWCLCFLRCWLKWSWFIIPC